MAVLVGVWQQKNLITVQVNFEVIPSEEAIQILLNCRY